MSENTRQSHILSARMMLHESRLFSNKPATHSKAFAWTLLEWAGNQRRKAAACAVQGYPTQVDAFSNPKDLP